MPAIIVIGASEGGVDAIRSLAAALPANFPAAIFVVLHIGANKSQLPALLNLSGPLPASHAKDGEPINSGRIYVAPPDHHLVIERGHMRLTRGPRENWARPAIDPLFRSAAAAYGADVVGIVLTGGLNDGTAGLLEIKRCGGTAIVQDPDDAANPSMPRSAWQHVEVDDRTPLSGLPALLTALVGKRARAARKDGVSAPAPKTRREEMTADYKLDDPVAVTCPDCGGALRRTELGRLTQYRCHIGHVYTAEVMVAAQFAALEWSLGAAMRSLSERGELCRQMADKARDAGDADAAAQWVVAMQEGKERTSLLRQLLEKEWTHPVNREPVARSG
jgi:two-component system, chemotaxis family, protein-glutamate methylesterase/glutaminase